MTNSEIPEKQTSIENPSDNSAFEENVQHIHTNIATFKRKPESDECYTSRKLPSLRLN